MSVIHVVSTSTGKDSGATLAIAVERFGAHRVIPIFCDTGNEADEVYEFHAYLERRFGVRIITLRADFSDQIAAKRIFIETKGRERGWSESAIADALGVLHPTGNPFLDLCLWKGRFPSRMAQFCTQELKTRPALAYQQKLMLDGHTVVSWQGVRRDESEARRDAKKFERNYFGMYIYRPIVDWTAKGVFEFHRAQSIEVNPLYLQGFNRVGCFPCINAGKAEIAELARRYPEHVARISDWELTASKASKRRATTFFHKGDGDKCEGKSPDEIFQAANIWRTVEWAKTTRGGQQYDLLAPAEDLHVCKSSYGLCDQG